MFSRFIKKEKKGVMGPWQGMKRKGRAKAEGWKFRIWKF